MAATLASAQTEPTPAAAPQTDAPAAAPAPADNAALNNDLDALLAAPEEAAPVEATAPSASAAATPEAAPASDSAAASPTPPADNTAVNTEADTQPTPSAEGAKEASVAELGTIPVRVKKDGPEPVEALRKPPTQLEEIVVTATKRPELVRDIPATISVLTGQKLEEMGAHELKDFIQSVPGINSQDEIAGLQRKLSIRGVGPQTGTNQTVGIVYADVALTDPYGSYTIADPDPWDLSTVEVMKGPQGTLFGATSLSGVIRYVPNIPKLGEWKGVASADWVSVDQGGTEPSFGAVLNIPVGETIAFRFAGSWQHKPGVIDIINPSYNKKDADEGYTRTGRIMALWQPTEELTLNAWYIKGQRNSNELNFISNDNKEYSREDAPGASPVSNGYTLATLDARYEFDWATLVSISAYQTKNSFNDVDTSQLVAPLAKLGLRTLHAQRDVKTSGYQQE
ncbi:MAG: TonB-dependent receptor, partial [Pseudomonadota bacterium]